MARKPPTLKVFANPWHGPLDENDRANTACPFDPRDNPGRGFVGAHHKLDEDGDLYWEFTQYEGTHGTAHAAHANAVKGLAYLPEADKDARAKAVAAIEASRKALEELPPDTLVLRAGAEAITLPPTVYYKQRIADGTLWAADKATHVTVFGHEHHFLSIEKRAELAPKHRHEAHLAHTLEKADPKPRPGLGMGLMGLPHAPFRVSAVIANPKGDPAFAKAALAKTIAALNEPKPALSANEET